MSHLAFSSTHWQSQVLHGLHQIRDVFFAPNTSYKNFRKSSFYICTLISSSAHFLYFFCFGPLYSYNSAYFRGIGRFKLTIITWQLNVAKIVKNTVNLKSVEWCHSPTMALLQWIKESRTCFETHSCPGQSCSSIWRNKLVTYLEHSARLSCGFGSIFG